MEVEPHVAAIVIGGVALTMLMMAKKQAHRVRHLHAVCGVRDDAVD